MISVIIPLFNKENFIIRAIKSVLNQSQRPLEIIVIDDGSTDNSAFLVVKHFLSEVRFYSKANEGVSATRNFGIQVAKGKYFAFLDADDYWHPNFLKHVSNAIEQFPQQEIIATSYTSDKHKVKSCNTSWEFIKNPFLIFSTKSIIKTSSIVIKKSFFQKSLPFNIALMRGEDIDVWYRAICSSGGLVYCKDFLVFYDDNVGQSLTKTNFSINKFLISIINNPDYLNLIIFDNNEIKIDFYKFLAVYVRLNIFRHFSNKENFLEIKRILHNLKPKYILIDAIFYLFPFYFLHILLRNSRIMKFILRYTNFCLKWIYKLKSYPK
jgi:glycosyltransferase involved in cell wall biosynthesis